MEFKTIWQRVASRLLSRFRKQLGAPARIVRQRTCHWPDHDLQDVEPVVTPSIRRNRLGGIDDE